MSLPQHTLPGRSAPKHPPNRVSRFSATAACKEPAGAAVSTEREFCLYRGTCARPCRSTARAHTPREKLLVKEV